MITKDLINFLFGMKRKFAFETMNYAGNTALNGAVCFQSCKSEGGPAPGKIKNYNKAFLLWGIAHPVTSPSTWRSR